MTNRYKPKKLIVEGQQDKRVIPELMEANGVAWGDTPTSAVVHIEPHGGDQFINSTFISTELKASGLEALGLIIDADNDLMARWESVRHACSKVMPDIPHHLPKEGLIHSTDAGIKFGVWIMPDNQTQGMLETFLQYLIPDEHEPIWQYAQEVVEEAKHRGATFIDAHLDKACIYTWLAWQHPPGRQPHNAVMEKILDPTQPKAQTFVNWFKQLYDL